MTAINQTILVGLAIALLIGTASWAEETVRKAPPAKTTKAPSDPFAAPADVAKPPASAIRTKSGLVYKVLKVGDGSVHPRPASRVTVNYTGWQTNGRMFDSSYKRGKPAPFPLNRVIKGWTQGLQLMVVGEKARFWIPAELAYGNKPKGGRPGGPLVFDIELIRIQ